MTQTEQKNAAKKFADYWIDLLTNVCGVTDTSGFISFEDQVKLDHTLSECVAELMGM